MSFDSDARVHGVVERRVIQIPSARYAKYTLTSPLTLPPTASNAAELSFAAEHRRPVTCITTRAISAEEIRKGRLSPKDLQKCLEALHQDGIVILEDAVSLESLDAHIARMTPEAIRPHGQADTTFNFGSAAQNTQQEPLPAPDMLFQDVLCNRYASQVIKYALGPEPVLRFERRALGEKALQCRRP
ncbi:hypothetical protein PUNSTDRAFT_43177 [Punctularia strigosozonata HHB-11173 SS5]|uniref:uncharacterized protein n=1 Tax=Punctularia strigosozonata (strain HHB-11173) TaxID=741275 RepID=UPI0004418037|nr:uncharacterized protein PUNSTDRAFT_43177 [Punctularia strigosozonata HHB-11173 SS5]EIN10177.1 hypothetical protein PUNSTDRAFT_43177 [Punctularia strigosozonata HHB-11173 SS5]